MAVCYELGGLAAAAAHPLLRLLLPATILAAALFGFSAGGSRDGGRGLVLSSSGSSGTSAKPVSRSPAGAGGSGGGSSPGGGSGSPAGPPQGPRGGKEERGATPLKPAAAATSSAASNLATPTFLTSNRGVKGSSEGGNEGSSGSTAAEGAGAAQPSKRLPPAATAAVAAAFAQGGVDEAKAVVSRAANVHCRCGSGQHAAAFENEAVALQCELANVSAGVGQAALRRCCSLHSAHSVALFAHVSLHGPCSATWTTGTPTLSSLLRTFQALCYALFSWLLTPAWTTGTRSSSSLRCTLLLCTRWRPST